MGEPRCRKLVIALALTTLVASARAQAPSDPGLLTIGLYMVVSCVSAQASEPMQAGGTPVQYCLERSPIVNQTDVTSAAFDRGATDRDVVKLTLNEVSAQRFLEATGKRIGLKIATVLNGRLISVATIAAPVRSAWISGLTYKEGVFLIDEFARGAVATAGPPVLPSGNLGSVQPDSR